MDDIGSFYYLQHPNAKHMYGTTIQFMINTEKYVKCCSNRSNRYLNAQIIIGILPYHIETVRFRNVKIEKSICQVCNNSDVENDFQFIYVCVILLQHRYRLYMLN